jgi:hypothetical protein
MTTSAPFANRAGAEQQWLAIRRRLITLGICRASSPCFKTICVCQESNMFTSSTHRTISLSQNSVQAQRSIEMSSTTNTGEGDAQRETQSSELGNQRTFLEERRYALIKSLKSQNGAEDFVRCISNQLLLQNDSNWGDLLGAAPAALCCLGQCFVAATASSSISSLELPMQSSLG